MSGLVLHCLPMSHKMALGLYELISDYVHIQVVGSLFFWTIRFFSDYLESCADPENGTRGGEVGVGVLKTFFSHQRISQRPVRTFLKKQLDQSF